MFDIILDVYEQNQQNKLFLDVLGSFKSNFLNRSLAMKFHSYQVPFNFVKLYNIQHPESKDFTPISLYDLAARLIQNSNISLDDIEPYVF